MGPPPVSSDDIGFKIKGSRSAAIKPVPLPIPSAPVTFAPPTGPKGGRERERRRSSVHSQQTSTSATVAVTESADPYAQEREARHRERVLKEQQRRESATLGKRPRGSTDNGAEGFDPPTGPKADKDRSGGKRRGEHGCGNKGRRVNYKYEDDFEGEARAARVEREREAARWD